MIFKNIFLFYLNYERCSLFSLLLLDIYLMQFMSTKLKARVDHEIIGWRMRMRCSSKSGREPRLIL